MDIHREDSLYLAYNVRNAFFSSEVHKNYTLRTCQKVCEALTFLPDIIYVRFGTKLFRQIVGIPMVGIAPHCGWFVLDLVIKETLVQVVPVLVLLFVALWFILRGHLLYIFPCVILFFCFSVLFVLRLSRLGKRELILMLSYVCSVCACLDLSVSSSSWGLGRAAVCDCGTPSTFLLPFFHDVPFRWKPFWNHWSF